MRDFKQYLSQNIIYATLLLDSLIMMRWVDGLLTLLSGHLSMLLLDNKHKNKIKIKWMDF